VEAFRNGSVSSQDRAPIDDVPTRADTTVLAKIDRIALVE
jgi:hypothetical protein